MREWLTQPGYIGPRWVAGLIVLATLTVFLVGIVITEMRDTYPGVNEYQRREVECRISARAAGHLDYIIRDKRETECDVLIGGGEVVTLELGGGE